MTVSQLIELLQHCEPDAQVVLAIQPNWPLAATLEGVCPGERIDTEGVVWLTEGSSWSESPYAPGAAWSEADAV